MDLATSGLPIWPGPKVRKEIITREHLVINTKTHLNWLIDQINNFFRKRHGKQMNHSEVKGLLAKILPDVHQ